MEKEEWNSDCPVYVSGSMGKDCSKSECYFQDYVRCPFYQEFLNSQDLEDSGLINLFK